MTTPFNTNLKDQVAVVTGGGGVLGSYFWRALADADAKVAVLGRTLESCETVASEIKEAGGEGLADHKASGFVTGIVIPVDGGFSAYSGV